MRQGKVRLTHPLVLAGISLVVNLLLNHVLVTWVVGVQDLDSLPSALAGTLVLGFQCQTGNDNGEGQTLRIYTSLDELLLACDVWVAADNGERGSHGGDPGPKHNAVAVLGRGILNPLCKRLLRFNLLL